MSFLFGGGGSKQAAPAPLPPPPPPIPPVVQTSPEVITASRDARRLALKRKGLASTVLAGTNLAGGTAYQTTTGQRTLMGGGS